MQEPTGEQTLKLWLWCELEEREQIWVEDHYEPDGRWYTPDGSLYNGDFQYGIPVLDLNNLFKWAVPKLPSLERASLSKIISFEFDEERVECILRVEGYEIGRIDKDPALALFWAIYPLIDKDML